MMVRAHTTVWCLSIEIVFGLPLGISGFTLYGASIKIFSMSRPLFGGSTLESSFITFPLEVAQWVRSSYLAGWFSLDIYSMGDISVLLPLWEVPTS